MHDARDRNVGAWIEPGDRLHIAAYSSVASLVVRFSGYWRKANGEVGEYTFTIAPTSDRVLTEADYFFGAGFLLSCVAAVASGNANRGQCYVRAFIQRGTGSSAVKLHNIFSGYVTDHYAPSFPFGKSEGPLEGPGYLRSVTGTDPAAGAEVSETVPTGARWRLYAARAAFVTDGTAANRQPLLAIDDGTTILLTSSLNGNQAASNTWTHMFGHWGAEDGSSVSAIISLFPPEIWLLAGWRIRTVTASIQAGDNWGAPQLFVEEWLEV